jgi:hypothetical protein
MPRLNVVILDQDPSDPNTYNFLMWADVPAARQSFYARPGAVSAWNGAIATDNTALQNGSMVEKITSQRIPANSTLVQIENFLQQQWSAFQASINSNNPWVRYGSTWDGTTWVIKSNG